MVKKAAVLAGVGLGLGAVYLWAANNALKEGTSGLAPPAYRVPPRHRVSLCVPAYNEEKYIGNLLTSARNQTESFHSMVVADCSEFGDSTSLMAMRLGAKVLRVAKGNISASRNLAAAWASDADILVFADADVILSSRFVEQAVSVLEAPSVSLVHPREAIYDSTRWNVQLYAAQIFRPKWNTTRCVAVWRGVFEAVGGYDENCNPITERCREDLDFGRRVIEKFGWGSVQVLPPLISTSSRRQKMFGWGGFSHFDVPVRARLQQPIMASSDGL